MKILLLFPVLLFSFSTLAADSMKNDTCVCEPRTCAPPANVLTGKKGPKKLAMELSGEAAKMIFDQMPEIELENGFRKGDSVKCGKKGSVYHCYFTVDADGVIEAQ
jgi:hypothetical protein